MKDMLHEYIKKLGNEIAELAKHIDVIMRCCEQAFKTREISEHVYLENEAVLKNEVCGIERFHKELAELDYSDCKSLDDLIIKIEDIFKQDVEHCGFAPCTLIFARRKIEKVREEMKEKMAHD